MGEKGQTGNKLSSYEFSMKNHGHHPSALVSLSVILVKFTKVILTKVTSNVNGTSKVKILFGWIFL